MDLAFECSSEKSAVGPGGTENNKLGQLEGVSVKCGYMVWRSGPTKEHLLCKKAGKITQVPHLVSLTRKHAVQPTS